MELIKLKGMYMFEWSAGGRIYKRIFKNVVTDVFFNRLHNFLDYDESGQSASALNINYLALGTGTTPAQKDDTQLESEQFRKQVTVKSISGYDFISKTVLAPAEGVMTITEIGMFCDATADPNNGGLISRAIVNVQKNSSTQLNITHILRAE